MEQNRSHHHRSSNSMFVPLLDYLFDVVFDVCVVVQFVIVLVLVVSCRVRVRLRCRSRFRCWCRCRCRVRCGIRCRLSVRIRCSMLCSNSFALPHSLSTSMFVLSERVTSENYVEKVKVMIHRILLSKLHTQC